MICRTLRVLMFLLLSALFAQAQQSAHQDVNRLIRVLVQRGVLQAEDVAELGLSAQLGSLVAKLIAKGILSSDDGKLFGVNVPAEPVLLASASSANLTLRATAGARPLAFPSRRKFESVLVSPVPAAFIPAVAPIRALSIDPIKQGGMAPDIRLGSGARLKPYGFVKLGIINDSSSPGGTDMPMPYLNGDTGPTVGPEFHIRARSMRIGTQFEWMDPSPKWAITGRFEADFEGNFSRAMNRNISSIRSSMFSIRLAYGRLDYTPSPRTTVYMVAGQDWTPFGSSTLPNLIETTGLGLGYGTLYERLPQARIGVTKTLGGSRNFKITPEFAIVMPSFGNDPTDAGNQLGYGERQGADADRPETQERLVMQWQFDRAPGVVPAQLIFAADQGRRTAFAIAAAVPAAYKAAFPSGASVSSDRLGWDVELQLPTRFVTLLGKYYGGKDLRFYFVGGLYSNFNDSYGFTNTATVASNDGGSNLIFGLKNGVPTVAPQLPVRTHGYMFNAGLPMSRIVNASPSGRNAGWTMNFHYSADIVPQNDARRLAGVRAKSDLGASNVQYKMNSLVTFGFEQSMYRTQSAAGTTFILRGIPARQWHDIRSEFMTQFTF